MAKSRVKKTSLRWAIRIEKDGEYAWIGGTGEPVLDGAVGRKLWADRKKAAAVTESLRAQGHNATRVTV